MALLAIDWPFALSLLCEFIYFVIQVGELIKLVENISHSGFRKKISNIWIT